MARSASIFLTGLTGFGRMLWDWRAGHAVRSRVGTGLAGFCGMGSRPTQRRRDAENAENSGDALLLGESWFLISLYRGMVGSALP